MANSKRRTPEQAAAYHQDKAKAYLAKAAKLKRDAETRMHILAGKAMIKAYLDDGGSVKVGGREIKGHEALWHRLAPHLNDRDKQFVREYLSDAGGINLED